MLEVAASECFALDCFLGAVGLDVAEKLSVVAGPDYVAADSAGDDSAVVLSFLGLV